MNGYGEHLKREEYLETNGSFEMAQVGDTVYIRDSEGIWRYADSWVKVPGARDVTLTEHFRPKLIVANTSEGTEVERVVVSGEDIADHPDLLDWCLEVGAPVRGGDGEVLEVLVPIEAWAEQDRIPGEVIAPENSDDPAEREVALVERKVREAELALEQATDMRAAVLREHSTSMTREQTRAITGLSVGRIQQLIRRDVELGGMDQLVLYVLANAGSLKSKNAINIAVEKEFGNTLPSGMLQRSIDRLDQLDLIENTRSRGYRATAEGEQLLTEIARRNADTSEEPSVIVDRDEPEPE